MRYRPFSKPRSGSDQNTQTRKVPESKSVQERRSSLNLMDSLFLFQMEKSGMPAGDRSLPDGQLHLAPCSNPGKIWTIQYEENITNSIGFLTSFLSDLVLCPARSFVFLGLFVHLEQISQTSTISNFFILSSLPAPDYKMNKKELRRSSPKITHYHFHALKSQIEIIL